MTPESNSNPNRTFLSVTQLNWAIHPPRGVWNFTTPWVKPPIQVARAFQGSGSCICARTQSRHRPTSYAALISRKFTFTEISDPSDTLWMFWGFFHRVKVREFSRENSEERTDATRALGVLQWRGHRDKLVVLINETALIKCLISINQIQSIMKFCNLMRHGNLAYEIEIGLYNLQRRTN